MGRANQPIRGLNLSPFVQGATQANAITASSGGGLGKALQFGVGTFIDAKNRKDAREDAAAARNEQKRQFDLQFGLRQEQHALAKDRFVQEKAEHASRQQGFQLQRQSTMMNYINKDIASTEAILSGIAATSDAGNLDAETQARADEAMKKLQQLRVDKASLQEAMQRNIHQQTHEMTPGGKGTRIQHNPDGTTSVGMGMGTTATVAAGTSRIKSPVGKTIKIDGEEVDVTDPRVRSMALNAQLAQIRELKKSKEYEGFSFSDKIKTMRREANLIGAAAEAALELKLDTAEKKAGMSVNQAIDAHMAMIPKGVLPAEEEKAIRDLVKANALPGALGTARTGMEWGEANDREIRGIVAGIINGQLASSEAMTAHLSNVASLEQRIANAKREEAADPGVAEKEGRASGIKTAAGQVAAAEYRTEDVNHAALGNDASRAAVQAAEAEAAAEPIRTGTSINAARAHIRAGLNPSGKSAPTKKGNEPTTNDKVAGGTDKDNLRLAKGIIDSFEPGFTDNGEEIPVDRSEVIGKLASELSVEQLQSAARAPVTASERAILNDAIAKAQPTPKDEPVEVTQRKRQSAMMTSDATERGKRMADAQMPPNAPEKDRTFANLLFQNFNANDNSSRAAKIKRVVELGKKVYGDDFTTEKAAAIIKKYGLRLTKE